MYNYDCVVMKRKKGSVFNCVSNNLITENLSDSENVMLSQYGYIFRDISKNEVHIIVNRFDVTSLTKATSQFYVQYV